jgi:hypothetical protein
MVVMLVAPMVVHVALIVLQVRLIAFSALVVAGRFGYEVRRQQLHAALRAVPSLLPHDHCVHRTRVDGATLSFRCA